jgi:hypothetical protein
MIRMLIVGYCFGIRSERRLCEEVKLNLAYRWFCRLNLEDAVPEHSTFSKNRHGRFRASGAFRWLFDEVVRSCMAAGLVKGEGFAVDASVVAADANTQRGVSGSEAIDWHDPGFSTRAVREYLEALDAQLLAQTLPKNISLTDPQSRWTAAPGGPAFYAYSTNYLVDTEHGLILDVEATPAHRTAEVESAKTMVDRVEQRFQLTPKRFIGDTAYGTASMLGVDGRAQRYRTPCARVGKVATQRPDAVQQRISVERGPRRIPLPARTRLAQPVACVQEPRTHITKADTIIYRSSQSDCSTCPMKQRCCPSIPTRKIVRSIHESARDVAREIRSTVQYQRSRHQRKKVEMLFAHLKRILKLDRLRLRGLSGACDEFTLAAAVQNLRRLAKLIPQGPPVPA